MGIPVMTCFNAFSLPCLYLTRLVCISCVDPIDHGLVPNVYCIYAKQKELNECLMEMSEAKELILPQKNFKIGLPLENEGSLRWLYSYQNEARITYDAKQFSFRDVGRMLCAGARYKQLMHNVSLWSSIESYYFLDLLRTYVPDSRYIVMISEDFRYEINDPVIILEGSAIDGLNYNDIIQLLEIGFLYQKYSELTGTKE